MRRLVAWRLVALSLLVALVVGLGLAGSATPLLFLAPSLLVLAPLLAGRYVGERSLIRLARTRRRRPLGRHSAAARIPDRPIVALLARGGRLLGCSLAVRPPPASV
jgi:hypothetical protein